MKEEPGRLYEGKKKKQNPTVKALTF